MDLPSLNGLRAFEAAARLLTFTRAADELHVTQTAVSHQIARLEAQLGTRLFTRHNRAIALTPAGQAYYPPVQAAFSDLRRATERLRRAGDEGAITVSTTASLATKWLVAHVAAFQEANPGAQVRITTSTELVDFRRDDVDMAIRYGRGVWPGVRADWLMAEEIFPVCAPSLCHGSPPLRAPADLAGHTLLHSTLAREDWQLWLTAAGLPASLATRRGLTFDHSFMAIQAAIEGLGVALGRSHLVQADLAAGRLVAPFDVVLPSDAGYYIVAPVATADLPAIARFRDWLVAAATPGALSRTPA